MAGGGGSCAVDGGGGDAGRFLTDRDHCKNIQFQFGILTKKSFINFEHFSFFLFMHLA